MSEDEASRSSELESVRRRPGMYVGNVHEPPMVLLREVLGNALDQWLDGSARNVEVVLHADDSVSVRDDGAGIAPDMLLRAVSGRHDMPTLDGHRPHAHLHPAGLGLFPVVAVSESFTVVTRRAGLEHRVGLSRGVLVRPLETRPSDEATGSVVTYRPDLSIFRAPMLDRLEVAHLLQRVSDLSPGLSLTLRDEGWSVGRGRSGLLSRVPRGVLQIEIAGSARDTEVRAALAWDWRGATGLTVESFVGFQPAIDGGTHVRGLERGLKHAAMTLDAPLDRGVHVCLALIASDVKWGAPTKDRVLNPELNGIVRGVVAEQLHGYFTAHPEALEPLRKRHRG